MPKLLRARRPRDAKEERQVRKLAGSRHAPGDWIRRARMVARSWDGLRTSAIAVELGCHQETVRERLSRFTGVSADTSATEAGNTPLTAPCTARQPSKASGLYANPMPTVAIAMPTTERTTIGLWPKRSASAPHTGVVNTATAKGAEPIAPVQYFTATGSATPICCRYSGISGRMAVIPPRVRNCAAQITQRFARS